MIKDVLNVNNKWRVIIYFNIDYDSLFSLYKDVKKYKISNKIIKEIVYKIYTKQIKAVTITNMNEKYSIVCFVKHNNFYDMYNSIIHESEHIKQSILEYYNIEDKDENPAYTIAYIATEIIKKYLTIFK